MSSLRNIAAKIGRRPTRTAIFKLQIALVQTRTLLLILGICLSLPNRLIAASQTFYPSSDSYVKSDEPDQNYGTSTGVSSGRLDSSITRSYIKFDLSSIPSEQVVTSATLRLDASYVSLPNPEIGAHYLEDNGWDETTITWNNAPTSFSSTATDTETVGIDETFWTVTYDVDHAYRDNAMYSVVLKSQNEGLERSASFWSKEFFLQDSWPYLDVEYGPRYQGGDGSAGNPFRISEHYHMNAIGAHPDDWDKHFILTADIDLSSYIGAQFNIIGTDHDHPFTGVFDGNGHTISNFTYTTTGTDYIGLFGHVSGESAQIKNLGLINPNINAGTGQYVGPLAGVLDDCSFSDCYVQGGTVVGDDRTGGLVGYAYSGLISRCFATCDVTGDDWGTGGLIGYSWTRISACYATGTVIGDTHGTGGLVGYQSGGSISSSYATASATASSAVGGLVGVTQGGVVRKCYAAGSVTGAPPTGGILGYLDKYGKVVASFWDEDTTGQSSSAGGGIKKSTAEMQDPDTFRAEGWDFVGSSDGPSDVWAEPDGGGYPILWWQLSMLPPLPSFSGGTGEPNHPYLISTPEDLNSIGYNPRLMESHFKLTDDVNLAGTSIYVIGNLLFMYGGVFDGNGHEILNLAYTGDDERRVGLFGYVSGETAHVKDMGVIGADVNAPACRYVGALVCWLHGTLSNCYCESVDVSGNEVVGGLVGWVAPKLGIITDCWATGTVHGNAIVGGLAGENSNRISDCYAAVNVSNTGDLTGGLAGSNFNFISRCRASGTVTAAGDGVGGFVGASYGQIDESYATGNVEGNLLVGGFVGYHSLEGTTATNCYATGVVEGSECVGGFVGYNSKGELSECYATGIVDGNSMVGGFAGYDSDMFPGVYSSCFWDSDINPDVNGIGNIIDPNVIGKTTAQMQTKSTFTDCGWDFVGESVNGPNDIWRMCVDGVSYPLLWWQFTCGDFVCPDGVDFVDYSFLASYWRDTDCANLNDCDRADLDFSNTVDWVDLKIFCDHWLEGFEY